MEKRLAEIKAIVDQPSSYKDYEKIYIGESDIAAITLSSPNGVHRLKFGEDGDYKAYLVPSTAEIGSHYELEWECKSWLTIFDDSNCVLKIRADRIKVYAAGMLGCIISCEGFESCDYLD